MYMSTFIQVIHVFEKKGIIRSQKNANSLYKKNSLGFNLKLQKFNFISSYIGNFI